MREGRGKRGAGEPSVGSLSRIHHLSENTRSIYVDIPSHEHTYAYTDNCMSASSLTYDASSDGGGARGAATSCQSLWLTKSVPNKDRYQAQREHSYEVYPKIKTIVLVTSKWRHANDKRIRQSRCTAHTSPGEVLCAKTMKQVFHAIPP